MNKLYRDKLITNIKSSIEDYKSASNINGPAFIGKIRELAVKNLFSLLLPKGYETTVSGKIVDFKGNQSNEIDLVIWNNNILPPLMFAEEDKIFPAEACLLAVEVKSKLTLSELKDSYNKAVNLRQKICFRRGKFSADGHALIHEIQRIIFLLFAFSSDLSPGGKSELDRYFEIDKEARLKPFIRGICVVGSGYWFFNGQENKWSYYAASDEFDEVIDFLAHAINSIHKISLSRYYPRIGAYIMTEEDRSTKTIYDEELI